MLITDTEMLELIMQVQKELPFMLTGNSFNALNEKLNTILAELDDKGTNTEHIVLDSMEAIQVFEPVRERLKKLSDQLRGVTNDGLLFDSPLGLPDPVEPGPLMVCPQGDNYKVYQRVAEQQLTCKFCGKPLIKDHQSIDSDERNGPSGKADVD